MWLLQLDDVWQLSISSAYLATLLIQFCWYLLRKCLQKTAPQAGNSACVGAGATPAAERLPSLRGGRVPLVLCCTLPSRWFPLSSTLTWCITHRIRGTSQVGGFFCRPDIVGNLHFGFTGCSWLGRTYFPGLFFQHFFWPHYIFWKMLEKPGKQNT